MAIITHKNKRAKMVAKQFNALYPHMLDDYLKNGGSTYSYEGKRTEGFAVGGYTKANEAFTLPDEKLALNDSYWFKHYVSRVVEEYEHLLNNEYYYIGTWHDKALDLLTIDIVRVFKDKDEALKIAKHREQSHIYDLSSSEEIKV